ncbi:MAG: helix-turn-helix transcriptional regulator, partial [Clostridia bacterium]|nr:helix-turn-helix transcriptional regulator [Clostridia bacterium]
MYECKIAEKLVELRNARGVTQEDVAQSLSISNKTVSKWENGASTPDLSILVELSKYYGVTTDTLLGLSEDKKQSTAEEIRALFEGLDRRESVLKAFEAVRALIPAMYGTVSQYSDDIYDRENV